MTDEELVAIKSRVENCMGSGTIAAQVLEEDASVLVAEVERLRETLEFYANLESYYNTAIYRPSLIMIDGGSKARAALEG